MATPRGNRPTKHDVELRRIELDTQLNAQRLERRYWLASIAVRGLITAACLVALALPIREFIRPIAGHTTVFSANVALSFVLGISGVVHVLREIKNYSRKRELERQREIIKQLEARLGVPMNEDQLTGSPQ
jgi:hypothetical protein